MKKIDATLNKHYFHLKMKNNALLLFIACTFCILGIAPVAAQNSGFGSEKTSWHGFDRYDFVMDEQTLEITPIKAPEGEENGVGAPAKGQRRCIVVVPTVAAPGNPWSWQACYWDHRPQAEVELLRRGFHIAFITPDPGMQWDAWYAFLTEKHGLSKKPAFDGMSKGGVNAYQWATANPDKVSAIYADNPAIRQEDISKLVELARRDVPLLNVCGSLDFVLEKNTKVIENVYHQAGGRITIMIKEGNAHHPHSLQDPKVIADFIEQAQAAPAASPAFLDDSYARSSYYSVENSYIYLQKEDTYATCRGPMFSPSYDRYDKTTQSWGNTGMTVLVPKNPAPGKLWVLRADRIDRTTSEVDLALLAKGYYIVVPPLLAGRGPQREDWNAVYQLMTDAGFCKKPALEGVGAGAGEAYGWAVENADKVSCIYGENPVLRSTMVTKGNPDENAKVPHIDDLSPLARAGVSILHVCGSLDPWLDRETRVAEKKYKELGGNFTVIIREGEGHFPLSPMNPKPVVEFIIEKVAAVATESSPRGAPGPIPSPRLAEDFLAAAKTVADLTTPAGYTGKYVKLYYPGISDEGQQRFAVTYTLWIPDGVKTLRGIIVHQHGAGMTASKEGSTAAYDLHWQALARKWDCALLGPCYHVLNDGDWDAAGSIYWMDPRRGSEKTFLKALNDFSVQTGHAELATVPWVLWGHSAGGIWSDIMSTLHPDRVIAVYCRSGSQPVFFDRPLQVPPTTVTPAACSIPMMLSCGIKEAWITDKLMRTFKQYRDQDATIGFAHDPRTEHECGDSRYFAIPYLDACLSMRLPDIGSQDQTPKPVDRSHSWLASLQSPDKAVPAAEFTGDLKESVWLPNEAVAKAYMEYVKTGAVGDTTPPPAPFNVTAMPKGDQGVEIAWSAEADFESGIQQFIILRDGQVLAKVPENPRGQFGRALFQSMTYHDTPSQPLPDMRFLDTSVKPGEKHSYTVITVNSVGIESKPSQWQYTFEPHDYGKVLDNVADVAVDSKNNIYALVRGDIPVLVFNAKGKYLRGWGQGLIGGPHGIYIDSLDNVFCVDSKDHIVMKFTTDGKLLMTLGTRGVPSNSGSVKGNFKTVKTGAGPFNVPTKVATSKSGDIFVTDGYGNARVHRFSADGKLIKSWGEPGTSPGQFNLPHGIAVDNNNNVYVADRENDRIQIFDVDGNLKKIWNNIYRPSAICFHNGYVYVTELGHRMYVDNVLFIPDGKGPWSRVRIFDTNGVEQAKFGEPEGWKAGNFFSPHGICVDKLGNIYVAEVIWPANESSPPKDLHPGLQKFLRQ
jgi:pimeloyl-ACP methyl ester carboxylesterase